MLAFSSLLWKIQKIIPLSGHHADHSRFGGEVQVHEVFTKAGIRGMLDGEATGIWTCGSSFWSHS